MLQWRLERGAVDLAAARDAVEHRAAGRTLGQISDLTGITVSRIHRLLTRADSLDLTQATPADFAPKPGGKCGPDLFTAEEVRVIRANLILSNRTRESGSLPAAIRRTIQEGALRSEVVEALLDREAAGKPICTEKQRHQLRVGPAHVRSFRNGRNAFLNYSYAAGHVMMTVDPLTGQDRPIVPGEVWTIDDGTKNFYCCVPTDDPSYPHGVMLGRYQFLLIVDHRSLYIPGFCHTARPKGSYRAEDLLATMQTAIIEHGAPKRMVLEKGISASTAITRALGLLGIEIERANTPHQKLVELVFNSLWTMLSFEPGQVGRFRAEEEGTEELAESCRRGAKDPRRHFPMLADALRALRAAIDQWNDHWVNGSRYGRWQPDELWSRLSGSTLRAVSQDTLWMFAPAVTDPLLVRGMQIATTVQLAEGYSQKFTFSSDWLGQWIGARVRIHHNPFNPEIPAKVVLASEFHGAKAGTVLGDLEMVDQHALYTLRAWGYTDAPDTGLQAVRRGAQALRRDAQAIRPDGKPGVTVAEQRDGLGRVTRVERSRPVKAVVIPEPEPAIDPVRLAELDEFERALAMDFA